MPLPAPISSTPIPETGLRLDAFRQKVLRHIALKAVVADEVQQWCVEQFNYVPELKSGVDGYLFYEPRDTVEYVYELSFDDLLDDTLSKGLAVKFFYLVFETARDAVAFRLRWMGG